MIQSSLSQQDLLFFVTLCRLQSLTVSAQKLNLSLSSACRMLTHLRETFGEPLFVRSRNGLMPTPGAMALLPKAIMLLDGFDDLFEPPVFDPAQAQRLIRIACADFGAVSILTKVIPAIIDKAPHLDFQILPIESDLVGKLSTGEIDFGIFPTEKTSPGIRSVRILESPYRYVVRRGHPLEAIYHAERKLTEEDLARWPNKSERGVDTHALSLGFSKRFGAQKISIVLMGNKVEYKGDSAVDGDSEGWRVIPATIYRYYLSKRTHFWASASTSQSGGLYKKAREFEKDPTKAWDVGAGLVHHF